MAKYKCETLVHYNVDIYVDEENEEDAADAANSEAHRQYPDAVLIDVQNAVPVED